MRVVRRIGALVLAVAAVGIFFGMGPESRASDISAIMVADSANQARAEGAPQQAVVNGWTARDLLELISKQLDSNHDPRPAALLTLAVLGLALHIFTSDPSGARSPRQEAEAARRADGSQEPAVKSGPDAVRLEGDHGTLPQAGLPMPSSTLDGVGRQ